MTLVAMEVKEIPLKSDHSTDFPLLAAPPCPMGGMGCPVQPQEIALTACGCGSGRARAILPFGIDTAGFPPTIGGFF